MAANVFSIKPGHDRARISLRGDMSVSFDDAVSKNFSVGFLTSTSDFFNFSSTTFKFRDTNGDLVSGLLFGGRPGLFVELMFDPTALVWYITANNVVGGDDTEKIINFLPLPALTAIDYTKGKCFRGKLTQNAKIANPTGMRPGDRLKIILEQDQTGGRTMAYDGAYGFPEAVVPILSLAGQVIDVLDCYMTGDYTLICDLRKNYSVIRPLAYSNNEFAYTMKDAYDKAQNSALNGQTVQVIRDGWRLECNGTIGSTVNAQLNLRIRGVPKYDGSLPVLRLDKSDRPTYGKALINIEGGTNVVVENLRVAGTSAYDDGNGTGILINGGVDYVRIENVHLLENEDGVRSSISPHPTFDLINVFLERNGWAANPTHAGYSHSIYAGEGGIWRGTSTTFYNPVAGHNIKTRSLQTILKQVYSRKCNEAREIDCCDQGVIHAFDSVFWKESDAVQNNLIGIGHECLNGVNRYQEYFFVNCYFHNDVNPSRQVTYLENLTRDIPNSVPVHFIDCEFGGNALTKSIDIASLIKGPYTITLTGGPTGPRVPVGSTHKMFDMNERDPNRKTNPTNVTLTPFNQLPPMIDTLPTPPYPDFIAVPPVPPLPSFSAGGGGGGSTPTPTPPPATPDTNPPTVSVSASSASVTVNGSVTFTATASDDVGVKKVEFYRDNQLLATDSIAPFTLIDNYTYLNNGTVTYKALAYDMANNIGTSNDVVVTVNITPPHFKPSTRLDTATQSEYDAAVAAAASGVKRMAAANAVVSAMAPDCRLYVYHDGVLVLPIEFTGNCTVADDGYDIAVVLPDTIDSSNAVTTGDLAVGSWWFELQGGAGYQRILSGSVGAAGSGADFEMAENPAPGQGFSNSPKFVMPRALDGLA